MGGPAGKHGFVRWWPCSCMPPKIHAWMIILNTLYLIQGNPSLCSILYGMERKLSLSLSPDPNQLTGLESFRTFFHSLGPLYLDLQKKNFFWNNFNHIDPLECCRKCLSLFIWEWLVQIRVCVSKLYFYLKLRQLPPHTSKSLEQ